MHRAGEARCPLAPSDQRQGKQQRISGWKTEDISPLSWPEGTVMGGSIIWALPGSPACSLDSCTDIHLIYSENFLTFNEIYTMCCCFNGYRFLDKQIILFKTVFVQVLHPLGTLLSRVLLQYLTQMKRHQ